MSGSVYMRSDGRWVAQRSLGGRANRRYVRRICTSEDAARAALGDLQPRVRETVEERFWRQVEKTPTCWLWTGLVGTHGYGRMRVDGQLVRAHRFSYELANGDTELLVCHRCDVKLCVRPDHLFAGTHADNMADYVAKKQGVTERVTTE